MKYVVSIFFCCICLAACNSNQNDKEKELLEKEKEWLKRENELLKKENATAPQNGESGKQNAAPKPEVVQKINWLGTWLFEDNGSVAYTLKIEDKYEGMNICTYNAEGFQTFYNLECRGVDNGDSFELYYRSTNEGVFYASDKIEINKPALTLKYKNGKVLTYWNQLINNYVEQGNHSGKVCFKKVE